MSDHSRFQSESTSQIAAALAKAQAVFTYASKDRKGFGYKYADIQGVLDAVRKGLTGNGIAVTQQMIPAGNSFALRTVLLHESGEWIASELPIPEFIWNIPPETRKGKDVNPMQLMGSCITYARRYSLFSIAGIAQDDDDGQSLARQYPEDKDAAKGADRTAKAFARQMPEPPMADSPLPEPPARFPQCAEGMDDIPWNDAPFQQEDAAPKRQDEERRILEDARQRRAAEGQQWAPKRFAPPPRNPDKSPAQDDFQPRTIVRKAEGARKESDILRKDEQNNVMNHCKSLGCKGNYGIVADFISGMIGKRLSRFDEITYGDAVKLNLALRGKGLPTVAGF